MKARIQRISTLSLLAHNTITSSVQVKQMETHTDTRTKAQLLACSNEATHMERIKMLKAQVDAGTYIVDSQALAQKMQNLSVMRPLPECEN